MPRPAMRFSDGLLMAVMPLLFSSNLVLGRAVVGEVEPWTLAFFRWTIAFLLILPVTAAGIWRHRGELLAEWGCIALLGFLGMWICGALVYLALRYTTATNATLIYTTSSVMILLLDWALRGRPVTARQAAGVVLAFLGVAIIVLRGELQRLLALSYNVGDAIMLFCALAWALYSVILKSPRLQRLPSLPLVAAVMAAGAASLFPFMLWETAAVGRFPATSSAWASIAAIALVSSVLSFAAYQRIVQRFGPSVAGMLLYLLPPYGVVLAVVFLGERLQAFHALGLALVLPGVVLATAPSRRSSDLAANDPVG